MTDATLGYLLVGVGILFVLGLVFTITTRDSRPARTPVELPEGVHLPPPSFLPVVMAVAAAVMGVGLIFSPWFVIPGLLILAAGAIGWLAAAGREWRDVAERDSHHDGHQR